MYVRNWMKHNRKCYEENAVMPIKNLGIIVWNKQENTTIYYWIKLYANNDPPIENTIEQEIQNKLENFLIYPSSENENEISKNNLYDKLLDKKISTIYLIPKSN